MKTLQLLALTSVDTVAHSIALQRTADLLRQVREISSVTLICPADSPVAGDYTGRCIDLGFTCDRHSYGWLQVRRLARYVHADFMLNVQADGYALNAEKWDETFLDYDYCGAPWPPGLTTGNRVGNSGFSLRSRRFMELSAIGPAYEMEGDDVFWCQSQEDYFLQAGCTYAPLDMAARFAIENDIPEYPERTMADCFGQHGRQKLKITPEPVS